MESCTLLFPLAFLILLPFPVLGARTRLLPSRLPALMMAFLPLLTSPPVFLPLLPSGAQALPSCARVRLNRLLLHPFLVRHPRPLGRMPFSFLSSPKFSPSSPHPSPVLACLPIPLPPVPSLSALLVSLHSLLLRLPSRQVAQCSLPCPFLVDIACHYVSLCRSLISLPSPSLQFPSATGGVNLRSRSFHYNRISKILVCTSFLYIHLSFCPYGSDPSTVQKSL